MKEIKAMLIAEQVEENTTREWVKMCAAEVAACAQAEDPAVGRALQEEWAERVLEERRAKMCQWYLDTGRLRRLNWKERGRRRRSAGGCEWRAELEEPQGQGRGQGARVGGRLS